MDRYKLKTNLGIPAEILKLLSILTKADFFRDGLLIGSWAMHFYQEILGIRYVLRTGDIDFALPPEILRKTKEVDLEAAFKESGMDSVTDYSSGLQKFLSEMYEIEFLVHRQGGKTEVKDISKYNINALSMPFLDILFIQPISIELPDCQVRIPCPEALFFHKMIIAQRRKDGWKKEKDLEQCATLAERLNYELLANMAQSYKKGPAIVRGLRKSCEEIDFRCDLLDI